MEKSKKALPIVLASALAATPFVAVPQQAHAIEKLSVTADNDGAGKESDYTIEFKLEEDLESGESITIDFDSDFDIDDDIDTDDIDASFDVKKVSVSKGEITIKTDEDLDEGDKIKIKITSGITNPDDKGSYSVSVEAGDEDSESEDVDIKKSSSDSSSKSSKDYAVSLSSKAAGEKVSLKLGKISLKGSDELESNSTITVTFPDKNMLPSSIDEEDVKVNGYTAKSVSVSGSTVDVKIPSGADADDYITVEFDKDAGIENPNSGGKHVFKVKYDGTTYESEDVEITKNGSSTPSSASDSFTVNLSDPGAGARTSYTFDADFGSKELKADGELVLEFPSSDMVPGILTASDFLLNGKPAKKATAVGNRIALVAPTNFGTNSKVKVEVTYGAWISNPKAAGSYTLKATVSGRTLESKSFSIGGSSVNPTPTNPTTPIPVPNTTTNNSTATIALTQNALGKQTGVNVAIKGLGVGLQKQRDFIEIVFPVGYKVPAYIAPANISVNGAGANFVAVRGQNVLIYPSQDIPAATNATIVINPAANIVNPAVKNTYSISVFTSEERGLLFARAVGVGMPSPAQPKPGTPTPQQPSTAIPANAASFKVNTANFSLNGKTYPLSVAPYLADGNTTMVPAQFFKEGLALTTQWNNTSVAVISGTKVVKFTVGSKTAKVGKTDIQLPTPVVLKNGMPMIPIRTVTDNLGYKVGWAAPSVYVYK
ncbi:copper amine oxidase N-terminal domain-containing protein [Brevibacillus porteri]|uniref:Copper amine oxidase n=1 Tax=Brevibacillus porteri TaxID=2126350 RepID=A0ABX5FPD8_9BACL|nr:copper amine oxidase N-terminal domain-containing protein [Brevibacillus porteri]MED1799112.1 copper amine oxidase N-terminal domain-containing protein [Brevibacillus porteri]MED2135174.1 copper amine oxidase N-terminal domain-containing protein [Brevibacillus porteri]MED2746703.1 copper amine oxidase N-terminal domain-containing protein [Brevibacillus porteri]MED2815027.1 copper amine oxidase N-terminal domain-containing protein [Brevibacillus porteri]MED2896712.1 copper amine oxidase N-te